jgi:hypothetical protein
VLKKAEIAMSMDGRGARRDNVFVERMWMTINYEEVHVRADESISEARSSIGRYLASSMRDACTAVLTGKHPTRRPSSSCSRSRPQHSRGGNPLIQTPEPVQRNRSTPFTNGAVARAPPLATGLPIRQEFASNAAIPARAAG